MNRAGTLNIGPDSGKMPMMLTRQNVESELSYAYLHAVASAAGFSCAVANRHIDDAGIDATVQSEGRLLADDSIITSLQLQVQLKATYVKPVEIEGRYSYNLSIPHYNQLRSTMLGSTRRILVVLYLPDDRARWLSHSEDGLIARRCAHWVSLHGAGESDNSKYQTVYIPRVQVLSPESITALMVRCSRREEVPYAG